MNSDLERNEKINGNVDKFEKIGDSCVETIKIIEKRIESWLKDFERKMSLNLTYMCAMDINKNVRMGSEYCNLTECSGAQEKRGGANEKNEL